MKMHISRSAAASINKAPAPQEVSIIARLTVGVGAMVGADVVKLVTFGTIPTQRQDNSIHHNYICSQQCKQK